MGSSPIHDRRLRMVNSRTFDEDLKMTKFEQIEEEWRRNLPDVLDGIDVILPLDPKIYQPAQGWREEFTWGEGR